MKYLLIFLSAGIFSVVCHAQQNEIADWQKKHPTVLFVEQSDYTIEFQQQLAPLNREVIVYQGEITMEDINSYAAAHQEKSTIFSVEREEDLEAIKIWLSEHPDLKIVARSVFLAQLQKEQDFLIGSDAMILQGEKITLQDIENYEATH
jgi:hypothetical protein